MELKDDEAALADTGLFPEFLSVVKMVEMAKFFVAGRLEQFFLFTCTHRKHLFQVCGMELKDLTLLLLLSTTYTTWGVAGRKRRLSAARRNAWAGGMLYRDSVSLTSLIQVLRGRPLAYWLTQGNFLSFCLKKGGRNGEVLPRWNSSLILFT